MKACVIKKPVLVPILIAHLGLNMFSFRATAQTFKTLHNFIGGIEGCCPTAGLILSSNTLYGTTPDVPNGNGNGGVFALNTDGTNFRTLYRFSGADGATPRGTLVSSGNTLYGTTSCGGSSGNGTVFAVNTDGTGFTMLYCFSGSDGSDPYGGLVLSGNTLYGTTQGGGSSGNGTVFAVNTDGTGFATLYSFTAAASSPPLINSSFTNSDGFWPYAGLVLSGSTLYGTAELGGSSGNGTIFRLNTDGTGFTTLYAFTARSDGNSGTNIDGAWPGGTLVSLGNTLYGTAWGGGSLANGTLFALNTDGTGFTILHNFSDGGNFLVANNGLTLSGTTLYGTQPLGGNSNNGTIFKVNTDGTGFATLYNFTATSGSYPFFFNGDGARPNATLVLSGNKLYGNAPKGGTSGDGTIFSISLPVNAPQLTISPAAGNVILAWPTNANGFTLQSSTTLSSSMVWATNFPTPVVVNGRNTVTDPVSATQRFYRLAQ